MEKTSARRGGRLLAALQIAFALLALAGAAGLLATQAAYRRGDDAYRALRRTACAARAAGGEDGQKTAGAPDGAQGADFAALAAQYPGMAGWLRQEGTGIDYPVMQAGDNDYYLRRLPDGSWNLNGSLFLDCAQPADFSAENSIIYGHNMHSGAMFASLTGYEAQPYYDAHPTLTLETPDGPLTLNARYGFTIGAREWADKGFARAEGLDALLAYGAAHTTFTAPDSGDGGYVTLVTCSYRFDNARYVLVCQKAAV